MSKKSGFTNAVMFLFSVISVFSFVLVVLISRKGRMPNIESLRRAYSGLNLDEEE